MLEELKKFPYKNKNFRHLALEVIALKVVRLLLKWSAYGFLFIFIGLLFQAYPSVTSANIEAVNSVVLFILLFYCFGHMVFAFFSSHMTHFIVQTIYQILCYVLFFWASIDKKLYQNLNDVIIPLTLFFMVLYLIVKKGYPVLEKRYLFKRVIDRQYLILGKDTNPTAYENHFYKDMLIGHVDLRMRLINERIIKKPYQDFVQLSFVNETINSAIISYAGGKEKIFTEGYHDYLMIFQIYPFTKQVDFAITFARIRLVPTDRMVTGSLIEKD